MSTLKQFFKSEYVSLLNHLSDNEVGLYGVLSSQGMIKYMSDTFENIHDSSQTAYTENKLSTGIYIVECEVNQLPIRKNSN